MVFFVQKSGCKVGKVESLRKLRVEKLEGLAPDHAYLGTKGQE